MVIAYYYFEKTLIWRNPLLFLLSVFSVFLCLSDDFFCHCLRHFIIQIGTQCGGMFFCNIFGMQQDKGFKKNSNSDECPNWYGSVYSHIYKRGTYKVCQNTGEQSVYSAKTQKPIFHRMFLKEMNLEFKITMTLHNQQEEMSWLLNV